jgi:hypothetical protein
MPRTDVGGVLGQPAALSRRLHNQSESRKRCLTVFAQARPQSSALGGGSTGRLLSGRVRLSAWESYGSELFWPLTCRFVMP